MLPSLSIVVVSSCLSQTMSTVNISHLGTDADVQLAEALVAVSEAVVAAAAEGDDTPRVVAVEETTHSEEDAVIQQVCCYGNKVPLQWNPNITNTPV